MAYMWLLVDGADSWGALHWFGFRQDGRSGRQVDTYTTVTHGIKYSWHLVFNLKELKQRAVWFKLMNCLANFGFKIKVVPAILNKKRTDHLAPPLHSWKPHPCPLIGWSALLRLVEQIGSCEAIMGASVDSRGPQRQSSSLSSWDKMFVRSPIREQLCCC